MKKQALIILASFFMVNSVYAQTVEVPFDSDKWEMSNAQYSMQDYEGKQALLLQSGFIYIKDLLFLNGTIELDINFSSLRNFPGVVFRVYSPGNFEEFYIRPHQSGNPDANQYTPVFNGLTGWQLYHGAEYATPIHYTFNEWHHLKIVVKGKKAEVYFDDMNSPLLKINELKQQAKAGTLGLRTFTNVHFANFQYTPDNREYPEEPVEPSSIDGLIKSWQLSELQTDERFADKMELKSSDTKNLNWTRHSVQSSGVLNIAQYIQLEEGKTTAIARLDIESDTKQTKKIDIGYSDFVTVYVNGQIIYSGANNFRSRDYRYLGTIGFFDSIYLPLKKGDNQVLFVVRENFGGWGIQARMLDQTGISVY